MPYRVVLHNDGDEEAYALVKTEREVSGAAHRMISEHGDIWRNGDTIVVFKITDVEAANEVFWENLTRTFIFASIQWTGFFIGVGGIGIAVFGRAIGII
jgi:hypothetical protein